MAASSVTMAALTSIGVLKVPDSHNAGTPRFSTFPDLNRYTSGIFGRSWKAQSLSAGVAFAQPSRNMTVLPVRASVGLESEVVEPATGIKFSRNATIPGASKELSLAGAGVRDKKIAFLKVKVYAVGLYVDSAVTSSLDLWKGKGASQLEKDEAFFKALIDAPVEKSLKIVLVRDIEGAQFWGALDEALAPRLKAVGAGPEGEKALAAFGDVFKNRPIKDKTVIFLTWAQPSTLQIAITTADSSSSAPDASIDSLPLLSCLYDVYLGKDPISPSAKAAIATGIFALA